MVVDFCHAIKFALIHAAIAIGFTSNMIFDVLFILVILRSHTRRKPPMTSHPQDIYAVFLFLNPLLYSILILRVLFYLNAEKELHFNFQQLSAYRFSCLLSLRNRTSLFLILHPFSFSGTVLPAFSFISTHKPDLIPVSTHSVY